jgi:nicotinamide-nucleotide amidase
MVRLRLSGTGDHINQITQVTDELFATLQQLVAPHLVTNQDLTLPEVVAALLLQHGKTIGTAESCTGGYIASQFTAKSGASDYFKGSVVAYNNAVKTSVLGVHENVITLYGAVSEQVVTQMAEGLRSLLKTDYVVAVSGIMGPGGGSAEKPVGIVWMAAASSRQTITQRMQFRFDRQRNIELTCTYSLNLLRQLMVKELTV